MREIFGWNILRMREGWFNVVMIDHIRNQYKKGFWWIPSETDRRGFRLPDETFRNMKTQLEPYKDEECVQVALMHVESILSSRDDNVQS